MLSTTDDEGIVRIYKRASSRQRPWMVHRKKKKKKKTNSVIATYARSWSLLGSLAAEEPPLEDGLNGH